MAAENGELTINEALEAVRGALGLASARPKELIQAARDKLQLPPPTDGSSFKSQIALVCDACEVATHWPASPRPRLACEDVHPAAPMAFPKLTVSVSWLKRFVESNKEALEGKTTHEVVRTLLVPQTSERGCSVAELLTGQRLRPELIGDKAMCVGEATCLVSHAWNDSFVDTVSTIVEWGKTRPRPDTEFVWMDAFAVSQHGPGLTDMQAWASLYRMAVDEIGQVMMVITPWERPSILSQLWCAWDFLCAVDSGTDVTFQLPVSEQTRLAAALETDLDSMCQVFRNTDEEVVAPQGATSEAANHSVSVRQAHARTEAERECLTDAIAQLLRQDGSQWVDVVDTKIRRHLREWCLRRTLVECRRRDLNEATSRYLNELAGHVAQCDDSEVLRLQQAEKLLVELLSMRHAELGADHACTQETLEQLQALRARLPVEEGEPPAGPYIQVEGLQPQNGVQYYKITWRDDAGVMREARHRYSSFDRMRNSLLKPGAVAAADVRKLPFPGKKWVHGTDLVAERAAALSEFLQLLVVTQRLITPSESGTNAESTELFQFLMTDDQ